MATQLRLVDPPPTAAPRAPRTPARTPSNRATGSTATRSGTSRSVRGRTVKGSNRRAAHWGEWQLDARTRRVGREGIAAARAALQQAIDAEPLPKAS